LACAVGAKPNPEGSGQVVLTKAFGMRWAKIELKKSAVGKNKKYRTVGKEGRLTRCPFDMGYMLITRQNGLLFRLIVSLSMVVVSSFTLAGNRVTPGNCTPRFPQPVPNLLRENITMPLAWNT